MSKVLTLNKAHILQGLKSADGEIVTELVDYFLLGHPISSPPRVRGSILLYLNEGFLEDNANCFLFGSPVDLGSVEFGFFNVGENKSEFIKNCKCDYIKFTALLSALYDLELSAKDKILKHKATNEARGVLNEFFEPSVVDFMYSTEDPHAWIFEVAFQGPYFIKKSHVENIIIPNTYRNSEGFSALAATFSNQLKTYNPKYGIEEALY